MLNTYEIVTMWKGKREGRTKRSFWLRFAKKLLEEVNTQDEAQEVATYSQLFADCMSSKNLAPVYAGKLQLIVLSVSHIIPWDMVGREI